MIHIGYIPYLNMVPFHQGFGPAPLQIHGHDVTFRACSPRMLGLQAERGEIDAGAMSLVDFLRLSEDFEGLGDYGIGVRRQANSVMLFSRQPLAQFSGV